VRRASLIAALLAVGCGTPPPPVAAPLRPPAEPTSASASALLRADCPPWDGRNAPPAVTPTAAARAEAEQLAQAASQAYRRSVASPAGDYQQRVRHLNDAAHQAMDSLERDPYNPRATLVLAAAYGALARFRCVRGLLRRVLAHERYPQLMPGARAIIDEFIPDLVEMPAEESP
jgi:hypothetical protein